MRGEDRDRGGAGRHAGKVPLSGHVQPVDRYQLAFENHASKSSFRERPILNVAVTHNFFAGFGHLWLLGLLR